MSDLQLNSQPATESMIDYQFPIEIVKQWHAFPVVAYMNAALTPRVQEYASAELSLYHSFDVGIWRTIFHFLRDQPKTIFCFVVAQRILPHGIDLNRLLNQYIIIKQDDRLVTQSNIKGDFVNYINRLPVHYRLSIRVLDSLVPFTLPELEEITMKMEGPVRQVRISLFNIDRLLLEKLIAKRPEIFLQVNMMKLQHTFMPISLLQNLLKSSHRLEVLEMVLGTTQRGDLSSLEIASLPYLRLIHVFMTDMAGSDIVCLLRAANHVEEFLFVSNREFPDLDFSGLGANSLPFLKGFGIKGPENLRDAFKAAFQRAAPHLPEDYYLIKNS